MAREPERFATTHDMAILAARAVGKIDRDGVRGATLLSVDETIAMAGILVALGLIPITPGTAADDITETLLIQSKEDPIV